MRRNLMTIVLLTLALPAVIGTARPRAVANGASAPVVQARATVKVSSFKFEPKVLTIAPGTTVEWVNEASRHSVEADDGSFKSDALKQGDKFEHKFDKPGTYPYHCEFHGEKGGKDMAGTIIVKKR